MTKLAEALIQRADYQKRIEQLKQRVARIAKVQDGDQPAENPAALLDEIERLAADLVALIQRINRTNAATPLDAGGTIADAIAMRDGLRLRNSVYTALAEAAIVKQDRYTKSEVRFVSTVDVGALQRRADDLAREYRLLDTRLQAANWQVDLLD